MVIVEGVEKIMSLDARGKIGYTSGAGLARCGYSRCGASKRFGGIYQRKKTLKGWRTSRMRVYNPINPQTETQQAWRSVFADAWVEYATLTSEQKLLLSKEARKYHLSGPQLFLRRYLLAHR